MNIFVEKVCSLSFYIISPSQGSGATLYFVDNPICMNDVILTNKNQNIPKIINSNLNLDSIIVMMLITINFE